MQKFIVVKILEKNKFEKVLKTVSFFNKKKKYSIISASPNSKSKVGSILRMF